MDSLVQVLAFVPVGMLLTFLVALCLVTAFKRDVKEDNEQWK